MIMIYSCILDNKNKLFIFACNINLYHDEKNYYFNDYCCINSRELRR